MPQGERLLLAALTGVGAEVLFRGFLHGRLTACSSPRAPGTGLAPAVLISAALYAAVGSGLVALGVLASSPIFGGAHPALAWSGALLFGLAAGTAREASGSVLPPIALHALAVVALAAL
jgi:membrane protease YdiL (CAAX protease family)